jgi:hypothetical protein
MIGEMIYEYDVDVSGVADYGAALGAVVSGQAAIPPQGARIDLAFEGRATRRVSGRVKGTDFARMGTDGCVDLDIRARVETDDGHRIALSAEGVALPRSGEPVADLRENVTLIAVSDASAWVDKKQIWGVGTVNFATGKIHIDTSMQ